MGLGVGFGLGQALIGKNGQYYLPWRISSPGTQCILQVAIINNDNVGIFIA